MQKLIVTDMDGTFLNRERSFDSERLHTILDAFLAKDYLFVAASGRSLITLEKLFSGFEDKMAFIAENGSVVKLFGKIIHEEVMTKNHYQSVIETLIKCPYLKKGYFLLSGEKGAYVGLDAEDSYVQHASDYYENVQKVADFTVIDDVIFKLSVNFSSETVSLGEAWVNEHIPTVTAVTTGFESIDVILKNVNKSTGLRHLCTNFNIAQSDIIAFGDNLNDLEMLEFAGKAIATDNARPEIKMVCDGVIGHCHDESVITYMESLV